MSRLIAAAVLFSLAAPAVAAAPGTAQNFLDRANRLRSKGPAAFTDGDFRRLQAEAMAAGESIRADRIAAEQAGRPKPYCSPQPKAALGQMELVRGIAAIPPAERATLTLKQAMLIVVQKKYPCPR